MFKGYRSRALVENGLIMIQQFDQDILATDVFSRVCLAFTCSIHNAFFFPPDLNFIDLY